MNNIPGRPHRKTIIWLGSDDGEGADGHGYDITREDNMVSVGYAGEADNYDDLQVFILPDLFPKIRQIMDTIEKQQKANRKLVPWQSSQPSSFLPSRCRVRVTACRKQ